MSQIKLNDVLNLYYKVSWEKKHPIDERAHWVTFEKIAYSRDWWFERFVNRAQKKIKEKKELTQTLDEDMIKIKAIYKSTYELLQSRNQKYWDSWKVMTVQAIASLCEMKLNRISQLGEVEAKTKDECEDVLNYMVFALFLLQK